MNCFTKHLNNQVTFYKRKSWNNIIPTKRKLKEETFKLVAREQDLIEFSRQSRV